LQPSGQLLLGKGAVREVFSTQINGGPFSHPAPQWLARRPAAPGRGYRNRSGRVRGASHGSTFTPGNRGLQSQWHGAWWSAL